MYCFKQRKIKVHGDGRLQVGVECLYRLALKYISGKAL